MNKKIKLALIAALLIAVMTVSFGMIRMYKEQQRETADSEAPITSEQQESTTGAEAVDSEAAEEGPLATLFFASDYQIEEGYGEPAENLGRILAAAKADGKAVEKVVMCGDYTNDRKLFDHQLSPDDSIAEIKEVVKAEYADAETMFVQGNHDRMTDQITPSGLYESEDYLIYIINTEEDFPWKQGRTAGCLDKVKRSSAALEECLDGLISKGETRPLFIAGHVPLHFTARTSSRHSTGDNLYSSLIFDVVNEAAKSLNITYLYGHNHSKGWDCYMGGSSVYKAKGDTLLIPQFSEEDINTDEYSEETLNFTYMNAGYVGYFMNCGPQEHDAGEAESYNAADVTLTGSVIEIYSDRLVVTRYDAEGPHVLSHAGEADPYKGGIDNGLIPEDSYSTETESPQEIGLER